MRRVLFACTALGILTVMLLPEAFTHKEAVAAPEAARRPKHRR